MRFIFELAVYFSNIERFNITGTTLFDYITTGNGNDTINGNGGGDFINAGGGNDTINAGYGDDNISGQDGNDYLKGEEGNDTIDGGAGNDVIEGGLGNDVITQGSGINTVDGGDGLDTLVDADFGSLTSNLSFNDSGTTYPNITLPNGTTISNLEYFTNLTTGNGNDSVIYSLNTNNIINTGSGNDTINSGLGTDTVNGGVGDDLLVVDYSSNTYSRSVYDDNVVTSITSNGAGSYSGYYASPYTYAGSYQGTLYYQVNFSNIEKFNITGTIRYDYIVTGDGNDTINGNGGGDYIDAGGGNDTINAGQGDDNILGQDGNDYLRGEEGNDTINGGAGNDVIEGGLGNDVITQGSGINTVDGGDGLDTLVDADFGSLTSNLSFNDSGTTYPNITLPNGTTISNLEYFTNLTTGNGNDSVIYSLNTNNIINTGSGNDTINSGLGTDTVNGGVGDDLLVVDYSSNTYSRSVYDDNVVTSITSNGAGSYSGYYASPYTYAGSYQGTLYYQVNFSNIEKFNITGTIRYDYIVTGDGNDTINGNGGGDYSNSLTHEVQ
ncbi:calcium-binding protein [Microcystis aeruginosa]|uniref:calcium-binding protein n=1 Tax=Microcystis aeruginosa TaxID=1126 RepID=UPI00287FE56B|nr:calcium-binding protein [Microcystis aeruginosa]WNF15812.1 calcium-binding protein [Microcystis aeruginosa NRERC-214]